MKPIELKQQTQLHKTNKQKKEESKKRKITNNTNKSVKTAKSETNYALLYDSWREYKKTDQYMQDLAKEIIHWVETDKSALDMAQFTRKYKIPRVTLWRWSQECKQLKDALSFAKDQLMWNREVALSGGYLHPSTVGATRHVYDEVLSQIDDEKMAASKQNAIMPNINVIIPDLIAEAQEEEAVES